MSELTRENILVEAETMVAAWALLSTSYQESPKVVYSASLSGDRRIIFGVYSDGAVWLRFMRPGLDLSFSLTPEAWALVRSLPENGLGHFYALAG